MTATDVGVVGCEGRDDGVEVAFVVVGGGGGGTVEG